MLKTLVMLAAVVNYLTMAPQASVLHLFKTGNIAEANTFKEKSVQLRGHGNDISWPQCDKSAMEGLPKDADFAIVGITGGRAFTENPCLKDQFSWANSTNSASVYVNVHAPDSEEDEKKLEGHYGKCDEEDSDCMAKNYGYNTASHAYEVAHREKVKEPDIWWLDVEELNHWAEDPYYNRKVIDGAVDFFKEKKLDVGIYSTPLMWRDLTGDYKNGLPVWPAIITENPKEHCGIGFTGGKTLMIQYNQEELDKNIACS